MDNAIGKLFFSFYSDLMNALNPNPKYLTCLHNVYCYSNYLNVERKNKY